jgi:hypothetical protein
VDGYLLPVRCLLDQRDRVVGVMIPAAHLDRWAETVDVEALAGGVSDEVF